MERQKVRFATLHDVIGVPTPSGMINLKSTLDPNGIEGKGWELEMYTAGTCLEVKVKGTTALVPMTNFKVIVLEKQ